MNSEKKKKSLDFSKYYPLFFTIIFVVILFQYSFPTLEAIFYDFRIRYDFGVSYKDNIVIVTMDEESDKFLGETYPYTYASNWRMFRKLAKDKPAIVNYLGNLLEPDTDIDLQNLNKYKSIINDYVANGGKFNFGTEMDTWGEQVPPAELQELGYSLALINRDNSIFSKDDVSRRTLLTISGEDSLHLLTANQYRVFQGEKILNVADILGAYYVRKADATFSLYRYYSSPLDEKGKIKKIPFHRVVVGNFPKGFFTGKIVLIGPSYISNSSDYVLTPFNKEEYKSSKLAVHAQIIQSLIQNKTVYKIPKIISYILAVLIAISLSITISRVKPTHGLFITVLVMVGVFLLAYVLFTIMGLWLYVTHLVLTVFVVYYIWVPFRAIAEYQRRFAIQEETKLLKKVENLKQNFISLMSHDLKTPVAKIAGKVDLLLQQFGGNEEIRNGLLIIADSTKELNKFITSILDLTKIESRNLNLAKISKDVNTIIKSVVEGLEYEAKSKGVEVETELLPLYPISIDTDLIVRVFSNLVENAIKYSMEKTVVKIKSWDDNDWVYVEISDNGVGIPKEDLEHVFDKFYRVKNDASHSIKGTGLGLYLVKYFVELHGGKIGVSSQLGRGTTFRLSFPNS
jgi:signal transduction histidine kinase